MYASSSSESGFEEDVEVPPTPPRSPRPRQQAAAETTLSIKEWQIEVGLMKLRGRYDPKQLGFDDYETWKRYQIKHRQPPTPPIPERRSSVPNRIPSQRRSALHNLLKSGIGGKTIEQGASSTVSRFALTLGAESKSDTSLEAIARPTISGLRAC